MELWDDENFEPKEIVTASVVPNNKWEGEDEEDTVKDNWEDDDEEQKVEEPKVVVPVKPKKKNIDERIAEKERQRQEELEKQRELEEEEEISPEERLRLQRESDLRAALETTFVGSDVNVAGLDAKDPSTKEEFEKFAEAIVSKVQPYSKHSEYPVFAETVVRNICASMSSLDIKKIKNTIDNLFLEKQKIEKGDKTKKSKGKGKAKLKLDNENQFSAYVDSYDEFNDFM